MKTDNWTARQIARACEGQLLRDSNLPINGFSIDTRTLQPGNLFVALKGENQDGHLYAAKAVDAGAAALLISNETAVAGLSDKVAIIKATDALTGLQKIAQKRRGQLQSKVIGITGSNGKTTTRAMLQHLLASVGRCSATSGNLNNHIGLPLTILGLDATADYAVLEMGMNHQGEIRDLCRISQPDAALISNIGPAHIGILGSLKNIALAKAEILESLSEKQIAVVPGDTEFSELLRQATKAGLVYFGAGENNDYRISELQMTVEGVSFRLTAPDSSSDCKLHLAGRHNAFNATAALALFHQLGHDLQKGCQLLESFAPVSARMERVEVAGINILLDCYNANPGSMSEALSFLNVCPAPRIAVLGDMRELGDMAVSMHRQLGVQAAASRPELLVCVGADAAHIAAAARENGMAEASVIALSSNEEAAEVLKDRLIKGSTVLFKASRGMHFETIVRSLWPDLGKDLH
ncbi:MAG: UDP-N-acetylmuramoyl-tripeptide--D-alanyl-D-alanine ligase [Candidatus Riflebacteria bacterium HGW-Riflebacteria-2]|nr:MAG: UDP-N-acetylmuramoyl-tripeptide--D-alanyl-D-alanine ligase [Candidatus Riflebacteria bacterium HGW-Riflebacteria-2]